VEYVQQHWPGPRLLVVHVSCEYGYCNACIHQAAWVAIGNTRRRVQGNFLAHVHLIPFVQAGAGLPRYGLIYDRMHIMSLMYT
jgi:hypothetical protein